MSVTPDKRKGELTGKFVSRYRLDGKRYYVGTFPTKRIAEVAERVHKAGVERLKRLTLESYDIEPIEEPDHTPWHPDEYRGAITKFLDNTADKFYAWRKQRRIQKALERDTFLQLKKMDTKQIAAVFDKD